jgi:hypothetical protein
MAVAYFLDSGEWPASLKDADKVLATKECENFELREDMLYRKLTTGRAVPYAAPKDRPGIVARYHIGLGHLKTDSIFDVIASRFWWPNQRAVVMLWLRSCPQCQLDASAAFKNAAPLQAVPPVALPFERWGILLQLLTTQPDGLLPKLSRR